jgi:hypothetical protein
MAKHSLSNRSLFDLQAVSGLHLGLSFPDHAKKLKTLATRLRFTEATAALSVELPRSHIHRDQVVIWKKVQVDIAAGSIGNEAKREPGG